MNIYIYYNIQSLFTKYVFGHALSFYSVTKKSYPARSSLDRGNRLPAVPSDTTSLLAEVKATCCLTKDHRHHYSEAVLQQCNDLALLIRYKVCISQMNASLISLIT